MDKYLRPARFDYDPHVVGADKQFKHWLRTFQNFVGTIDVPNPTDAAPASPDFKLTALINYASANVYEYITDCDTYDDAIETLTRIYVKPVNEIYARYKLATCKQTDGETLDTYIQTLHRLSKDCNFQAVTAEQHRQGYVRDAFISGIQSRDIRQKLLENVTLTMEQIFEQARTLQTAQLNATSYAPTSFPSCAAGNQVLHDVDHPVDGLANPILNPDLNAFSAAASSNRQDQQSCFYCGYARHQSKNQCPARKYKCKLCGKIGHWERVCKSSKNNAVNNQQYQQQQSYSGTTAAIWPSLATTSHESIESTNHGYCQIKINKHRVKALIDTGSTSCSFIHKKLIPYLKLTIVPCKGEVSMANSSFTSKIEGTCFVTFSMQNRKYEDVRLYVLDNLCADVILGQDFMKQHQSVVFEFGGSQPPLLVSALTAMNISPPRLFEYLTEDCRPIAVKSRKQTPPNAKFIRDIIRNLLNDGVIKPSTSPWRAQVLVTKDNGTHKKRMVIDYKQTINRFTELDAYPLPDTEQMVRDISQFSWFSTFDLKSAYHQVPISEEDQKYTAFEADGGLWEFTRMLFGVTNGVSKFQRNIDMVVEKEGLSATFPYLDNVTVCGRTPDELKTNMDNFREMCQKYNLTLNEDKSILCVQSLPILGYLVSNGEIKPDPERLLPLQKLAPPCDLESQRRIIGMFAYYSRWIPKYSDKIRPLNINRNFPLTPEAMNPIIEG